MSIWGGLLPKTETQALQFIRSNPSYDGKGIVVGILDTGVDPAAVGLQVCPDGRPKVIDVVDCTGSGDIHMGDWIVKDADADTLTVGVDGKKIMLNKSWTNPSGKFRYASKKAFDGLYPSRVVKTVRMDRKKQWDKHQAAAEHDLQQQLDNLSLSSPSANGNDTAADPSDAGPTAEELKSRIAALRALSSYSDAKDAGPVFDCLVWHNGACYEAAINTAEPDPFRIGNEGVSSDFSRLQGMCNYREKRQYSRFSDVDSLTYAVNIFDEGTVLSVVSDAGAHGTHVAGIVAAYHPPGTGPPIVRSGNDDDDAAASMDCNGVAPGAQIISLKIGDTRIDSMETGVGLVRAAIEAVKRGCHIINMSYGEAAAHENFGYFVNLANDIVSKHNVLFVSSAGNNGPALSTVGCPGGLATHLISVGAFAPASLMPVGYHINAADSNDDSIVTPTNYTWSSVGPSPGGAAGVSIMAPGGAITCVPTWTHNKSQLMNGTSMSSPNACGCIALVMSGIIGDRALQGLTGAGAASAINYAVIRRVVENSAKIMPGVDTLGQGHGMIQVQSAFDLMQRVARTHLLPARSIIPTHTFGPGGRTVALQATSAMSLWYNLKAIGGYTSNGNKAEGIYLRTWEECSAIDSYKVDVTPLFAPQCSSDTVTEFEQRVVLKCTYLTTAGHSGASSSSSSPSSSSSAEVQQGGWVSHSTHMLLVNSTKTISIKVDPSDLAEGHHCAVIRAYMAGYEEEDKDHPNYLGALFEVPVTVVKPAGPSCDTEVDLGSHTYSPGDRFRRFLVPPPGAAYVELFLEDCRGGSSSAGDDDDDDDAAAKGGLSDDDVTEAAANEDGDLPVGMSPDNAARLFVVHGLQLLDSQPYRDHDERRYYFLRKKGLVTGGWRVQPGVTMEVCIARYWSTMGTPGDVRAKAKLVFRGTQPSAAASNIIIQGGSRVGPLLNLHSMLSSVEIAPQGKLTSYSRTFRPCRLGKVTPLGERDVLPVVPEPTPTRADVAAEEGKSEYGGQRLYQLVLEYAITLEAGAHATPSWPGLQGVLYESRFHCQFYSVYHLAATEADVNAPGPLVTGQRIGCGDAWPEALKVSVAGTYLVRLHVRHSTISILEGLTSTPLVLTRSLTKSVALSFYQKKSDCMVGEAQGKFGSAVLHKGQNCSFYVREPLVEAVLATEPVKAGAAKKGSKDAQILQVGDVLTGKVSYLKSLHGSKYLASDMGASAAVTDSAKALDCVNVTMILSDSRKLEAAKPSAGASSGSKSKSNDEKEGEEKKENDDEETDTDEALEKAVLEAKVKHLQSLIGSTASLPVAGGDSTTQRMTKFDLLYYSITAEEPDHLNVRLYRLRHAVALQQAAITAGAGLAAAHEAVLAGGKEVLSIIDATAVAANLGLQKPQDDDKAGTEARKVANEKKAALQETYRHCALAALYLQRVGGEIGLESEAVYKQHLQSLQQWEELTCDANWCLWLQGKYEKREWGTAVEKILELLKKNTVPTGDSAGGDKAALTRVNLRRELLYCLGAGRLHWPHLAYRVKTNAFLALACDSPDR